MPVKSYLLYNHSVPLKCRNQHFLLLLEHQFVECYLLNSTSGGNFAAPLQKLVMRNSLSAAVVERDICP